MSVFASSYGFVRASTRMCVWRGARGYVPCSMHADIYRLCACICADTCACVYVHIPGYMRVCTRCDRMRVAIYAGVYGPVCACMPGHARLYCCVRTCIINVQVGCVCRRCMCCMYAHANDMGHIFMPGSSVLYTCSLLGSDPPAYVRQYQ